MPLRIAASIERAKTLSGLRPNPPEGESENQCARHTRARFQCSGDEINARGARYVLTARASLFVSCVIRIRIRELFFLHGVHSTTRLHCHRSSDTAPAWPEPIALLGYRSVSIPYLLLHLTHLDWQGVECSKMALVRHPDSDATVILNGSNSVFPSSNGCTWMGSTLASDRRYCREAFPLTFAILACDLVSPCSFTL